VGTALSSSLSSWEMAGVEGRGTTRQAERGSRIWTIGGGPEAIRVLGQASFARVAFSPDGKTLASSCEETVVKLWDVESGREFAGLEGHPGYIRAIAFPPDGRSLASGAMDTLLGLFPINLDEMRAGRR
jgi:WD40 repeat protein